MMPFSEDPDVLAMRSLADGNDSALNEIMERWVPRLAVYLTRYVGNPTDALDLTQETFVGVYRARNRYRPKARFSTWLFGIASNLARQRLRWRKRHPEAPLESESETVPVPSLVSNKTGLTEMQLQERVEAVRNAIQTLPSDLREAVLLSEYEDLSHAEIATIMGCSVKAVETRLYRARAILRKILAVHLGG